MRKLTLMTLIAGVLATASIPASAATIVEDFDFLIGPGASTNDDYLSSTFAGFNPALGTLTSVTISVTGSLIWSVGEEFRPTPKTLQLVLETPVLAVQMVSSFPGDTKHVDVDLNGAGAFIGSEPQQALLGVSDDSDGSFTNPHVAILDGVATYTYTPAGAPVPEPSTWAMMLVGFAGLGYAAVRRKAEVLAARA